MPSTVTHDAVQTYSHYIVLEDDESPAQVGSNSCTTSYCIETTLLQGQYLVHVGSISVGQPNATTAASYPQATAPLDHPITTLPEVPIQSPIVPQSRKRTFECPTCRKTFDRKSRLEGCQNRHLGVKPYECLSHCGLSGWYVADFLWLSVVAVIADKIMSVPRATNQLSYSAGISQATFIVLDGKCHRASNAP